MVVKVMGLAHDASHIPNIPKVSQARNRIISILPLIARVGGPILREAPGHNVSSTLQGFMVNISI